MNVSLFQAAAAMNANTRWQESIAENLASSSIPGFKKQDLSFNAVQAGMMSANGANGLQAGFALPHANASTNFQGGELKYTGQKTDVAIEGQGFFELQQPGGSLAYTRDGEFRVSTQGVLTSKSGLPVMGTSGPIQLDLNNSAPISISTTGEVSQGESPKGKIKLATFANPQLLTSMGGGNFQATAPGIKPTDVAKPSVRQGFLESSNTASTLEMSNLISAMRQYEANEKVIQMQDDRMGKSISEIATPQ